MPPTLNRSGLIILWVALLLGSTWVFRGVLDSQNNPNQRPQTISHDDGSQSLVLKRNRLGHYVATGSINNHNVSFLLDTGATRVSIPADLADMMGLQRGTSMMSQTANGSVTVYSTLLKSVRLGNIEIQNVSASINPGMTGMEVLLGMSFLRHLQMLQQGDQMFLQLMP